MGQYYRLINLDKRQTLFWGKLIEGISDCYQDILIPYLTVPATPLNQSDEYNTLIGSWAGDRIALIGDYAMDSWFPEGMLTDSELEQAEASKGLYRWASSKWETARYITKLPIDKVAFAHDKVWVLRNLTKKRYVRVDAFGADEEDIRGPCVDEGHSLADVLVSEVTCAEADRGSFGDSWLGDRFDIQRLETVENDEEWEDISEGMVEEVKNRWFELDIY